MEQETASPYGWKCHPEAARWLGEQIQQMSGANGFIARLEEQMARQIGCTLFDWVDQIALAYESELVSRLEALGFVVQVTTSRYRLFYHPGAQLPRVALYDDAHHGKGLYLKVESISDFLSVHGLSARIEGSPFSPLRRCCCSYEEEGSLWLLERRSQLSIDPVERKADQIADYLHGEELWKSRPRRGEDEEALMGAALSRAEQLVQLLGRDVAAWLILACERHYWQTRNRAGQIQKNRQDRLGLGWGNHDHHTFRSSRRLFGQLVRLFEMVGFHCRERFYAGKEAGWGAQVMENERCGLVLFLDVDLSPEELAIDFAHQPLAEKGALATIGLWCALHGDSILEAGMHHLEAQFAFELLEEQLKEEGVGMMAPFSHFSYLKQAFTEGEWWSVHPWRIEKLLQQGAIDEKQAERFLTHGAIGSHMENLERKEGYKGFNQKNVSTIIRKTDPRRFEKGDPL